MQFGLYQSDCANVFFLLELITFIDSFMADAFGLKFYLKTYQQRLCLLTTVTGKLKQCSKSGDLTSNVWQANQLIYATISRMHIETDINEAN